MMSYFKKPEIPYGATNTREWDLNEVSQDLSSSDGDEDIYVSKADQGNELPPSSNQQQVEATSAQALLNNDDEGFQPVIRRFPEHAAKAGNTKIPQGKGKRSNNNTKTSSMFNVKRSPSTNGNATFASSQAGSALFTSQPSPQSSRGRSHERLDAILRTNPTEVKRIQELKLCHPFFLCNDCPNHLCPFNHQYKPNESELRILNSLSKTILCNSWRNCRDKKCAYGHPNVELQKTGFLQPVQGRIAPMLPKDVAVEETLRPLKPPQDEKILILKPMFQFDRDNAALAAFRHRQDPIGSYELHKDIVEIEPDPRRLHNLLAELGVRLGSFIRPPQTVNDRKLLIWGNIRQFSKTREELRNWVRQLEDPTGRKSLGKQKFASEYSTIGDRYKNIQKDTLKRGEIVHFQQIPDPDQHFEYKGAFLWPVDDVEPRDIFGSNLEAFDQIRFALKSHIVFDDKLQVFWIYTDKDGAVARVLKLIEGTLKEFHARNILNGQLKSIHLVHPPQCETVRKDISLRSWSSSTGYRIPVLTGVMLDSTASKEWELQSNEIRMLNAVKIQDALQVTLFNLKHYRGHIRIKLLFGTFALVKFRWPRERSSSLSFKDFMHTLVQPGTKATLIKDLCLHKNVFEMLPKVCPSNGLFEPLDSVTASLLEVAPMYGARFEINRFENTAVQLEVNMTSNVYEEDLYEKTHVLWTNLNRKDNSVPLDIFMIRFGGPSWNLRVWTEDQTERSRIDSKMMNFADSVRLRRVSRKGAEIDGRKLFEWETALSGCLKPSAFEQKIASRYRLRLMPEFIFELARYDSYNLSTNSQTPSTTHWGASMWNTEWDIKLSKNANLGLGESAEWDPRLEMFFPIPEPASLNKQSFYHEKVGPGLSWFLQNVQLVAESLDNVVGAPPDL